MALDRQKQKSLQAAERLLKQGKVREALAELERVAVTATNDLLTLNRIGDLLARQGHPNEAIRYYVNIAAEFTRNGFYPKAVAIHKKILRLHPDHPESLIALGELYGQQSLPGEARKYLLHATEKLLERKDFAGARAVCEKLVAAEPSDPRHRARLAETRAAEGDNERAGEELLLLAESLFGGGKPAEAEQTYRRAGELLGDERHEPLLGISRCLREQGKADEAITLLREAAPDESRSPDLAAELAVHYASLGREDDALELLRPPAMLEAPADTLLRFFRVFVDAGSPEGIWEKFDPILETWTEKGSMARACALLARLGTLEATGHIPALQRLYGLSRRANDKTGTVRALEELIRAYGSRSMIDEASLMRDRLRELAPQSPLLAKSSAAAPPAPRPRTPRTEAAPAATDTPTGGGDGGSVPVEVEAPAVPLNHADEEFVTGRMTQAEILEKYGLLDQAADQVGEIIAKFPGHVPAQERRVALLRNSGNRPLLREALIGLALARRAAGDLQGARGSAAEAAKIEAPSDEQRAHLESLGLIDPPAPPEPPAAEAAAGPAGDDDEAVVIDFDDERAEPAAAAAPPPAAARPTRAARPVRAPGQDMIEEIRSLLSQGEIGKARRQVETLKTLGYASPDLERLAAEAARAATPPAAQAPPAAKATAQPAPPGPPPPPMPIADDDDDLSTITAALEGEMFADDPDIAVPETQSEQSLEDVFAAFKQHVAEEVDSDDFRTHYDLGIAFKEMGLVDEAIGEFQTAVKSDEIAREACIMIALCHRESGRSEDAIEWYRRAIDAAGKEESLPGLRYDLADTLLATGDPSEALDIFRELAAADPKFRDVRERIAELEARQTS